MKPKPKILLRSVERLLDAQSPQEIALLLEQVHALNWQLPLPLREHCQQEALRMARERMLREMLSDGRTAPECVVSTKDDAPLRRQALALTLFSALLFAGSEGLALSELCYSEEAGFWLASPRTLAGMQDGDEYRRAMELYRTAVLSATPAEAEESGRQFRHALLQRLLQWAKREPLNREGKALLEELEMCINSTSTRCISGLPESLSQAVSCLFVADSPAASLNYDTAAEKAQELHWLLGNCPSLRPFLAQHMELSYVIQLYRELERAKHPLPAEEQRRLRLYLTLLLTNGTLSDDRAFTWALKEGAA